MLHANIVRFPRVCKENNKLLPITQIKSLQTYTSFIDIHVTDNSYTVFDYIQTTKKFSMNSRCLVCCAPVSFLAIIPTLKGGRGVYK